VAVEQLAAAFLAAVLLVIGIGALIRSTSVYMLVALGLLAAVPFAGLVTFVIFPRPPQDFGLFVNLALLPALFALGAGIFAVSMAMNRGQSLSARRLNALGLAYVVLWVGVVLAISALLATWEPEFALANIVLNAAWICLWALPQLRRLNRVSLIEIKAPRERVFEFTADASNWPRYDEQLVSARVEPPGPLRVGSRVTEIRNYDSPVRGPRLFPATIEVVSEVTGLVPGQSLSLRDGRHVVRSTTEYSDSEKGTRVAISVSVRVPFHQAFLGAILLLRSQQGSRRARSERNLARLKEILEQP